MILISYSRNPQKPILNSFYGIYKKVFQQVLQVFLSTLLAAGHQCGFYLPNIFLSKSSSIEKCLKLKIWREKFSLWPIINKRISYKVNLKKNTQKKVEKHIEWSGFFIRKTQWSWYLIKWHKKHNYKRRVFSLKKIYLIRLL